MKCRVCSAEVPAGVNRCPSCDAVVVLVAGRNPAEGGGGASSGDGGPIFWWLQAFKRFAEFGGRSRRKEYWWFTLMNMVASFALVALSLVSEYAYFAVFVYMLAAIIPGLAVTIRRLHDTGRSGWWILITVIPIIGLVLLYFMVQDSEPQSNQWGPNPKS